MFVEGFLDTISEYSMISESESIIVGLSGGADSVCLLLNLLELKKNMHIKISAIHIHHGIRGEEADLDALFCKELCEKHNINLITEYFNVPEYAVKNKMSTEEAARDLRYQAFKKHSNGMKIATAHNLSDNAETMLHNIFRGSGLKGYCGIPPLRDNIIRPLLNTSRNDIEKYLEIMHQEYKTDSTNLITNYTRNKIRLDIIPSINKINKNFINTASKNIKILSHDEDYLEKTAEKEYLSALIDGNKLDISKITTLHIAILTRCIAKFLRQNNLHISYDKIYDIINILSSGGKINYAKNVYIISKTGILSIISNTEKIDFCQSFAIGENKILDKIVISKVISFENFSKSEFVHKNFANYFADYDKIHGDVVIRNRKNGDKFQLMHRNFTSSVKKLLQSKLQKDDRKNLIFLEDANGIVFIEKFGFSECVKADDNTKRILLLNIQ